MSTYADTEVAIRQLHARYGDAVWRKDFDTLLTLYTNDCQWRFGGKIFNGPEEIVGNLRRVLPLFRRVLLTFRTPILSLEKDGTACSRTYMTEQVAFMDGRTGTSIGTYWDRFKLDGGEWKFTWRLWQAHYFGNADLSGSFYEQPEWGAPPNMPPLDAPTYDRTGVASKAWS